MKPSKKSTVKGHVQSGRTHQLHQKGRPAWQPQKGQAFWIDQDGDKFSADAFDFDTAHRHQLVLVGDAASVVN